MWGPDQAKDCTSSDFGTASLALALQRFLPYSSGHPAQPYIKGSWCGASRAEARRRQNNFCFLSVMVSVVSQQSQPHCREMPRRSGLSFLLGLFHVAELTGAFVLLRLV